MHPQEFRADLHIHSRFSRATSKQLNLPLLAAWAALKGLDVIGTGDFTHPQWREELASELALDEKSGLYALKDPGRAAGLLPEWADSAFLREKAAGVRFMLQAEISSIYKRGGKTRKVHNLVFMPGLKQAEALSLRLAQVGNLASDGRPILGLDSEKLLDLVLNTHDEAFLVPAHVWTPWFSLFGSKSGFDSLEECYGSLAGHIFALETGLSSDPEMNRRLSALDHLKLISNSDAHSGENLAREANIFAGEVSYSGMLRALRAEDSRAGHLPTRFLGTLEFFPDEGKYHLDGHRACNVVLTPAETRKLNGLCPVCGKPLTLGVLYRVQELADRAEPGYRPDESFTSLVPLPEIAGEILGTGSKSRQVGRFYQQLLRGLGSELDILSKVPLEAIGKISGNLAEGIGRMRRGEVYRRGGYDGEFGVISVFSPDEQKELHGPRAAGRRGRPSLLSLLPEAASEEEDGPPARRRQDPADREPTPPPAAAPVEPDPAGPITVESAPAEPAPGGLNPGQAAAVQAGPGPVLVQAGPGTGKTHTLIARILHLLRAGRLAGKILAVTFTRRAASELGERLSRTLDGPEASRPDNQARQVRADTLHALAFEFWASQPGETPVLLDEDSCLRVFAEANLEESVQRRRSAWAAISLCREKMEPVPAGFQDMYERYTQHKSAWNLADYTDLLEFWLTQAKSGLFPLAWSEILVDEVQDLSPLQLELFRTLLPADGHGFFGIGDPDQSIYGFRGAHGRAEEYFKAAWPALRSLHLTENYRSGPAILDLAQTLFEQKAERLLLARLDLPAEIHYFESNSAEREATWVAEQIRHYLGATSHSLLDQTSRREAGAVLPPGRYTPGDIAVLVRSRLFMPPLRKALERAGIPFSQPSQDPFWNDPLVQRLLETAGRALGISPALAGLEGGVGPARSRAPLDCPAAVLLRGPLSMAAYFGNSDPFDSRFWKTQPFKDFTAAFEAQKGWIGLFNWLALQNELEQVRALGEQVQLITYHAAKGLEFPLVFLPALEDGILPFAGAAFLTGQLSGQPTGQSPLDSAHLEEEKRLFYVGLTRAREGLFISRSEKRHLYGRELRLKPSRFLNRLPIRKVRHSAVVAKVVTTQEQMKLF
ncbi:MAG: UvrD-helicase domain-containing protein [Deltaproteobacteria bacterium]|jgi:uncharacterized protein (TIGR00375 family)|nr:UvrD-helicase domain-containing protein [Deltaproteobacteria bacterium]